MNPSIVFKPAESLLSPARRPSIWSELLHAMPIVVLVVAVREAWSAGPLS